MRKAALKDGIKIKVVSGFRDFDRQKMIWNSKFKKFTSEYNLSAIDAINEIIRFFYNSWNIKTSLGYRN